MKDVTEILNIFIFKLLLWTFGKIIVCIGITALIMLVAALVNAWALFGYLMALNLSLWLALASIRENKLGVGKWLALASFIIWSICLTGIFYYWQIYYKKVPDFTILGMHPGFFLLFPVMWLLTFIPVTLSYALLFSRVVLRDEDWNEFLRKVKKEEVKQNE